MAMGAETTAVPSNRCPACDAAGTEAFYSLPEVPVHSVRLLRDQSEARNFPTGRIELAFCDACGFVWNRAFDASLLDYGADYEETQGFSETFGAFHRALAERLVTRHGLTGKHVVEIGCGKGEFLNLLCELGAARGTGIDPAYLPERDQGTARDRVAVIREYLSERHRGHDGDFVCCKMTLEHIAAPARFLQLVAATVARRPEAVLFFQVPEALRLLDEGAFWDVYYEHCSYFSPGSLARLFRRAGFALLDLWTDYDGQYLMIEARRSNDDGARALEDDLGRLREAVARFPELTRGQQKAWHSYLGEQHRRGRRVALWGGGSKAVAFLTSLGIGPEVAYAVDINPHKQGHYLPLSGHPVVGPDALMEQRPDAVIVMNPIYRAEIARALAARDLAPDILLVSEAPRDLAA